MTTRPLLWLVSGERNSDAKGIVFSKHPTEEYFQEVQLRLRTTIEPNYCSGYEVFWRCLRSETAYAEIVRWNGKVGDFTSLARLVGAEYGVKDGDLVEASAIGDELKGFVNGVEVISATDGAFQSGGPGIGFNFGVGETNVDHGFTHFEVESFDDCICCLRRTPY